MESPYNKKDSLMNADISPEERIRVLPCGHSYMASSLRTYYEAVQKYNSGMLSDEEMKDVADECLQTVEQT